MCYMGKQLILLALNEINFDVVEKYVAMDVARFPSLKRLLEGARIRTVAEQNYEELEPWIQWPSVHTGKSYADHGVFRLGDMVGSEVPQIFERLEQAGRKVGVISAMNAENRLNHPAYFIPDPWTKTPSDGTLWSRTLSEAVSQAVNDNAKARITIKSAFQVVLGLLRFARLKHYVRYLELVTSSRKKPWLKALVLDLLLHDVHWNMFNRHKPDFSTLFLNAGAHIQHHYFFNAKPLRSELANKNPVWYVKEDEDPLSDVLDLYDLIVGEYFSRADADVILATGLAQKPYDRVKFYYRMNDHADFLRSLGIAFTGVFPRMTRDFLIEFTNEQQALQAHSVLSSVTVQTDGLPLFGEIDNRGSSLFVTLSYPHEITAATNYSFAGQLRALKPRVSFVAIKNGMHQSEGFAFFTPGVAAHAPEDKAHVGHLGSSIMSYFGLSDISSIQ